tara:strand:- start:23 stop:754 length:732 start_codon:yes stop_codon:yes gene_type:complete
MSLEYKFPFKKTIIPKIVRWMNNGGILILNNIFLKLFFPFLSVNFAIICNQNNIGLLNIINIPLWVSVSFSLVIFDLIIYSQHYMFHKVSFFWKFHKVHHSDIELDVTTGLRFHTIEIFFSTIIKLLFIFIIGPAAIAVLIFEIILNLASMFNHSNIYIPNNIEKIIKLVFVTPKMHRIHHSRNHGQLNSNFGFNFSFWDRFFLSYKSLPTNQFKNIEIGINEFRSIEDIRLDKMLIQPFKNK